MSSFVWPEHTVNSGSPETGEAVWYAKPGISPEQSCAVSGFLMKEKNGTVPCGRELYTQYPIY